MVSRTNLHAVYGWDIGLLLARFLFPRLLLLVRLEIDRVAKLGAERRLERAHLGLSGRGGQQIGRICKMMRTQLFTCSQESNETRR